MESIKWSSPRDLAERMFGAAVAAVDSRRLVEESIACDDESIRVRGREYRLTDFDRVVVVGAGKAGAGMVAGVEAALASCPLPVIGQVNVPDDCVRETTNVELVGARPAGRNEPTARGVEATERILEIVSGCGSRDLCVVLISGGGSALLTAPVTGLTVEAKRDAVARLAAAGADIHALNTVRRRISRVKGGGLLSACGAGVVETLVISDVVGDDLATIASGPTVITDEDPLAAEAVYRQFLPDESDWPAGLREALTSPVVDRESGFAGESEISIIGSNDVAVTAAARCARELGCDVEVLGSGHEGEAAEVGRLWADRLLNARDAVADSDRPMCLIDGGEPVVSLAATSEPRKGGRNQELVLAAITSLGEDDWSRIALLSGGTDGEDGPTDAAGAVADATVVERMREESIDPEPFLAINNSYPFFEAVDGLVKTGPTHTNVMDVRVGVVWPEPS